MAVPSQDGGSGVGQQPPGQKLAQVGGLQRSQVLRCQRSAPLVSDRLARTCAGFKCGPTALIYVIQVFE